MQVKLKGSGILKKYRESLKGFIVIKDVIIEHHFLDAIRSIVPFLFQFLVDLVVHLDGARFHNGFFDSKKAAFLDRDLDFYLVLHNNNFDIMLLLLKYALYCVCYFNRIGFCVICSKCHSDSTFGVLRRYLYCFDHM